MIKRASCLLGAREGAAAMAAALVSDDLFREVNIECAKRDLIAAATFGARHGAWEKMRALIAHRSEEFIQRLEYKRGLA